MKRLIDIVLSLILLALFAPIMALAAAAISIDLGTPVLFRQSRPGLGGRPFTLLKFRTMAGPTSGEPETSSDERRLTRLGRALRASSIDELPELWNVLRGDMSLVGPRPLLMRYLPLYSKEQMRRHEARPGITGWAQVNGRNALSWEDKFRLDVWYVDHQSLFLDLKILALTTIALVRREGISHEGSATMPEFEGASTAHPKKRRGSSC
jgi:sugar transferase EpsL